MSILVNSLENLKGVVTLRQRVICNQLVVWWEGHGGEEGDSMFHIQTLAGTLKVLPFGSFFQQRFHDQHS